MPQDPTRLKGDIPRGGIAAASISAIPNRDAALKHRRFVFTMTAILFLFYFGYLLLISLAPGGMMIEIGNHLTLGLALGIACVVVNWLLACFYVAWANKRGRALPGRGQP